MCPATSAGLTYYAQYARDIENTRAHAHAAEGIVRDILAAHNFDLHIISGRAKDPLAALQKLRRKQYEQPEQELTDQVGVRVITYYADEVDPIAAALRTHLEVDPEKSVDKRGDLRVREFGYRSVHLLSRVREPALDEDKKLLEGVWFEIQVRSILEHAWAEIEHEVVYKAGIEYPDERKRQFSALAGTLEILEREFLSLRAARSELIELYRQQAESEADDDQRLDAARLLGVLEAHYPEGRSWRKAEKLGAPFPPRLDACMVEALAACEVTTPAQLRAALQIEGVRASLEAYAQSQSLAVEELSHLVIALSVVLELDRRIIETQFLELRGLVQGFDRAVRTR